ncbi:hypothetical protein Pcinc_027818 [Petrolisthes cinctipes]|uniref:HEAT repeat-containing protein 6 n=1 Tax=Petrolisthes cinctipes TaxID=88211 RepID=A0AAE1F4D7_PETCI|nr:hypothetical protein Pcinc_027818 [Petrolisthes cinctipes]
MWRELVGKFLKVESTGRKEVTEAQLAQCLPDLCHCVTKLRFIYDQRQVQSVVEHCVSGVVDPSGSKSAKQIAMLLASLLPGQSRGMHLSSALSDRITWWLSHMLQHHAAICEANSVDTVMHILRVLTIVLKDIPDHSNETFTNLGGSKGSLVQMLEGRWSWRVKNQAMQCLHLLTYVSPEVVTEARQRGEEIFPPDVVSSIQRVVIGILRQPPPDSSVGVYQRPYLHLVASGISVLYNLVICAPGDVLGNIIVSTCRPFIFCGLPGYNHTELLMNTVTASDVDISLSSGVESDSAARKYTNRNRRKRLRRKRAQPSRSTGDCSSGGGGGLGGPVVPSLAECVVGPPPPPPPAEALHTISLKTEWTEMNKGKNAVAIKKDEGQLKEEKVNTEEGKQVKSTSGQNHHHHSTATTSSEILVSSSETDHSDLEGNGGRESVLTAQVRQCSLQAINAVIDKVGGQNKFSYWAPLMCPGATLMTCVLRDPAPGVRMAALQVINTFLLDSAQVLSLADDSESGNKGSYSTLGHQLGTSVRELHRCLARALLSERVPVALVRTLKTAELLVQNVNYSKLQPGLLTKLVTHVKYFMTYKEAVVRANAFSVMVSVLMVKPQVAELRHLLLRHLIPAPPALAAPPSVVPQPPLEEHLPGEEEELEEEVEQLHLQSEEGEGESGDDKQERKTMVSWLVRRCVDSLLAPDTDSARGIYIQVQLQSLKVLSALVSEHLSLIQPSLPLIQHVITVCSEVCKDSPNTTTSVAISSRHTPQLEWRKTSASAATETFDPSLTSPDPDAVVEHTYTLLGALLGAVKTQQEKNSTPSASTSEVTTKFTCVYSDPCPTSAPAAHSCLTLAQQNSEDQPCLTSQQALNLWLWALQSPLQPLFKQAKLLGKTTEEETTRGGGWRSGVREGNTSSGLVVEEQVKHMVAMAAVLTHLSPAVVEEIGEIWLDCITNLLHHLLSPTAHSELRLAGIRIMAIAVGFPGITGSKAGLGLVQGTAEAACDFLLAPREVSINRDRLLAAWALANVTSVLELYSSNGGNDGRPHNTTPVLSSQLTARMVEAGLVACRDKGKIKPHGVRCVGNVVAWALRLNSNTAHVTAPISSNTQDVTHTHDSVPATLPHTCTSVSLSDALVCEAVEGLVECATTGSNMKTRWNACHALGSILAAAEVSLDHQTWKGEVMAALSHLVEGFKNYKVRIHACSAVTGLTQREGYGTEYVGLWGALLRGLDAARGIPHYLEARHRDDLVNQISQGLWQLTAVVTLKDAGNLSELLHLHHDIAAPLLNQAYHTLPPERTSHALRAQARVEELLACDALTELQQSALTILESFTCMSV